MYKKYGDVNLPAFLVPEILGYLMLIDCLGKKQLLIAGVIFVRQ